MNDKDQKSNSGWIAAFLITLFLLVVAVMSDIGMSNNLQQLRSQLTAAQQQQTQNPPHVDCTTGNFGAITHTSCQ